MSVIVLRTCAGVPGAGGGGGGAGAVARACVRGRGAADGGGARGRAPAQRQGGRVRARRRRQAPLQARHHLGQGGVAVLRGGGAGGGLRAPGDACVGRLPARRPGRRRRGGPRALDTQPRRMARAERALPAGGGGGGGGALRGLPAGRARAGGAAAGARAARPRLPARRLAPPTRLAARATHRATRGCRWRSSKPVTNSKVCSTVLKTDVVLRSAEMLMDIQVLNLLVRLFISLLY